MSYTLTEAAKAVGRTRQALQVAIKKGTISAEKDAFGQWLIDPAELHRVYPPVKQGAANETTDLRMYDSEKESQIRELRAKLDTMERLYDEVKGRAEELKQERDNWKQQADEWRMQAKALPAAQEEPAIQPQGAPKRGFWAWFRGK